MSERNTRRLLVSASLLTLVALGLMIGSILIPRPIPVVLAMSVGQAIGTAAFAIYLVVIAADLRRRSVQAGLLLLAALWSGSAEAQPYRLRGSAFGEARAPVGLLLLGAEGDPSPWVDAEAMVWAGHAELGATGDVLVAAVRVRDPGGLGEARAGRLIMTTGAIRPVHLDGVSGLLRLPWGGTLEVFGGLPVSPEFDWDYDWMVGGRAAQSIGDWATVGLAYLYRRDRGRLTDQEIGLDLSVAPLDDVSLSARGAYDLVDFGISEVLVLGSVELDRFSIDALGTVRTPSRILPATSLFSVLGDVAAGAASVGLEWRAAPRLDLTARAGALIWDGDAGEDLSLRGLLRFDDRGLGSGSVELTRKRTPESGWTGVRATVRVPLVFDLTAAVEAEVAVPDQKDEGSVWPWGLLALSWQPTNAWQVALAVEGESSPLHERAANALLRASYQWSRE